MKRTVAAVSIALLFLVVVAAGAVAAPDEHGVSDSVAALTRNVRFHSVDVQQHARPLPLWGAFAVLASVALVGITTRGRGHLVIGPRRRRIGDVGDDWRALLLGAPPRST